ncbi:dynamin-related protein 4C-like [Salvia hispanica]|uniref:dynamin-related protein 4C-like n=1 Tax=Salvia hispanica TaxID=49212 RepID=UPI002008F896|nr:dynamin-related protein 4C-like [Salvia hispanica]
MGRKGVFKASLLETKSQSSSEFHQSLSLVSVSQDVVGSSPPTAAPLVSSYNDRIRPLLDAVDRLRHLKIMQEGIQLPTIVVVGDQSSGKSSVLESLAGIRLPRGDGICTRVPLIMSLKNHTSPEPQLFLEFNGRTVQTDEENVVNVINYATQEIAGQGKGISNTPLTLVVKKKGVPDLTMIDLPGITRVPVKGQPEDISEQISSIIMNYITPEESIILNVLSAGVDFPTCESIKMSQRVDKTGQRTLAVVTKADKNAEGLLEKIVADDVNIGLGYVCVINRVGDESYDEARAKEARLFETNPMLARIDKSIVGIPALAARLTAIQANIIVKCLPDIVRKINEKLSANVEELNKMPKNMSSVGEAMTAFMNILGSARESLRKILLRGEFDEYPTDDDMHATARLAEMMNKYSEELRSAKTDDGNEKFLIDEIKVLEESRSVGLPNFIPKSAFRSLLAKKVKEVSGTPFDCAERMWSYVQNVVIAVLVQHCDNYPQLISCTRRAAQNLIWRKKEVSEAYISDLVEMEKLSDYTCNGEYTASWNKLMAEQGGFMEKVRGKCTEAKVSRFGDVHVEHLWDQNEDEVRVAYDLKMRMVSYWEVVTRRMVDNLVLHLLFSVQKLVNKEVDKEIIDEVMGPQGNGLERMLEESPSLSEKRSKLHSSIALLKQSKDIVATMMDNISA